METWEYMLINDPSKLGYLGAEGWEGFAATVYTYEDRDGNPQPHTVIYLKRRFSSSMSVEEIEARLGQRQRLHVIP